MRRITSMLVFLAFIGYNVLAQDVQITGKVTNADDGSALPGVSVVVKGTTTGTTTNVDGMYSISVPPTATLVFSFVGMQTQEIAVGTQTVINVEMKVETTGLEEVVVTALGITREKKSLGYATQQVSGSDMSTVKTDNFANVLSGKVAGLDIKVNGNMGGSTNIVMRGSKSLFQSNQALIVIDGVPVNNANDNNQGQTDGRNGYDYGNTASDIDPNDIESVNVLKGAAATALYGSRAANGVIMITTKKGSKTPGKNIGVTVNSNVTFGMVDKSTFPKYQLQYGGGYGPFYSASDHPGLYYTDVNGDGTPDYLVPTTEDASMGEKFDPNLMVYQWDSFIPESDNYGKAYPWQAAKNGPITFFNTAVSYTNSVDISGGNDKATYRLGYTNNTSYGIMPNSSLKKNNLTFSGSYNLLKNLKVSSSAQYIHMAGLGRNSTGYSDNILTSFRQWFEVNVDIQEQKKLFDMTNRNVTWNENGPDDLTPIYWDNPYWIRAKNYESDGRDRLIGYTKLDWTATKWLSFMGRVSIDSYNEIEEERKAIGSVGGELGVDRPDVTSGYARFTRTWTEMNYDLMANFHKDFGKDINVTGLLGTNIRRSVNDQVFASTNGGLSVPDVYALSNSVYSQLPPEENYSVKGVNGYFGDVSIGYKGMLYLDGTFRRDISSTLPSNNWGYNYPSITGTFLFSELMHASWLQLGKLRLNYAQVGNDAPWGRTKDVYTPASPFNGNPVASVNSTKYNPELKPERTKSIEGGLTMNMFSNRVGFDLSLYKTNTFDLITPIAVSFATGYAYKYVNAGQLENKGVELTLNLTPVQTSDFSWNLTVNWAKNNNKVVALAEGIKNLQLDGGLQGGVSVNARVGEPYGTIEGSDYVYLDGQRVVKTNGYYQLSPTSDITIGNTNPDWTGGITNQFNYKNLSLSFLIDVRHGGDVFSLDMWYGLGTGLYDRTAYTNDLGNPVRDPVQAVTDTSGNITGYLPTSGGLILDGVHADGTPNTRRVEGGDYRVFGWAANPNAGFVYDASYVKLRNLVLTYNLPKSLMDKTFIYGASISFVGSNLWIIHKNLPYADPESGQSSGNVQGWQSGVMPATRNFGVTVNLQF